MAMSPSDLDAYAEVMTRRGIARLTVGGDVIEMTPRLVNSEQSQSSEKQERKRPNGVDAALSV